MIPLGVKGTRNLKQDLTSLATKGLTVEERRGSPSRVRMSEVVAFGRVGEEEERENGLRRKSGEEEEDEKE